MKKVCLITLVLLAAAPLLSMASGKSPGWEKLQYRDDDKDGKNDTFQDADGDGVNDVSGKPYRHHFQFIDADGDGINDVFSDSDGNGINDFPGKNKGEQEHAPLHVIDFDEDGFNDVTGKLYSSGRHGMRFLDEDGDGISDSGLAETPPDGREQVNDMDTFKDEDGDGINDGRGFGRTERVGGMQRRGSHRDSKRDK